MYDEPFVLDYRVVVLEYVVVCFERDGVILSLRDDQFSFSAEVYLREVAYYSVLLCYDAAAFFTENLLGYESRGRNAREDYEDYSYCDEPGVRLLFFGLFFCFCSLCRVNSSFLIWCFLRVFFCWFLGRADPEGDVDEYPYAFDEEQEDHCEPDPDGVPVVALGDARADAADDAVL